MGSRPPAGQHQQKGNSFISNKSRFSKVEAARRATSTKKKFVDFQKITIFQGRGRPQGNINKKEIRLFQTNRDFPRSRPPAGQHQQKRNSLISKKSRFFKVEAARRATSTKRKFVYFQKITIFQGRGRPQGNINKKEIR